MGEIFEHQGDDLPVGDRQRLNGCDQPDPLALLRGLLLRLWARVDWLLRFNDLFKRLLHWMTPPCVTQSLIVRNAVDKRALRTLTTKARQRPPDRQRNLLEQVLSLSDNRLITGSQTRQRGAIFAQNTVEVLVLCRGCLRAADC